MVIKFSKKAKQDFERIKENKILYKKTCELLNLIQEDPFKKPPSYEKLLGYKNAYSRRINKEHRLVYIVYKEEERIAIVRIWSHYEKI